MIDEIELVWRNEGEEPEHERVPCADLEAAMRSTLEALAFLGTYSLGQAAAGRWTYAYNRASDRGLVFGAVTLGSNGGRGE